MSDYPYRAIIGFPLEHCGAINAAITTFWPEGDSEDPTFVPNASTDGSKPATWAVVSAPATEVMVEGMRELREEVSPNMWIYVLHSSNKKPKTQYGGAERVMEEPENDFDDFEPSDPTDQPLNLNAVLALNGLQKIIVETEELI